MNAGLYHTQAQTMIALARATEDAIVRAELLALAERFTRLSQHADRFGVRYGGYFEPEAAPPPADKHE